MTISADDMMDYDSDEDDIGEDWRDFSEGVIDDESQFLSKVKAVSGSGSGSGGPRSGGRR